MLFRRWLYFVPMWLPLWLLELWPISTSHCEIDGKYFEALRLDDNLVLVYWPSNRVVNAQETLPEK